MKVSVVTTLYHSSEYIDEFCRRAAKAVSTETKDFEILLVNDGSPDDSLKVAKSQLKRKIRVKIIDLSRNFGHHKAMMKGLANAKGDYVFMIDCDLEEPPELFVELYRKMRSAPKEDPCDLVQAVQNSRKGGFFERFSGHLFYRFFNSICDIRVPPNSMMARLVTRRFLQALLLHEEREYFLSGLISLTGFRQEVVVADKKSKGKTTYNLARRLLSTLNAITSFSDKPLFFIFYSGIFLSGMALAGIFVVTTCYFLLGIHFLAGWASIMLTVCFLGGFGIASVGVVGLYLGRIFMEVKRRPSIIKEVYSNY